MTEPGLILFDIDGTLLNSAGNGVRAMGLAVERLYGIPDAIAGIEFAGRTDYAIWRDIYRARGLGLERLARDRDRLNAAYVEILTAEMGKKNARLCPGIPHLLPELLERGFALGLLTGNLRGGAEVKLRALGIWDYFPFGAFGDEDEDRGALLAPALAAAAAATGREFTPARTLVVGDTLHDYHCARRGGAKIALVATGTVPAASLIAAQPDLFHPDYADYRAVAREMAALLDGDGR